MCKLGDTLTRLPGEDRTLVVGWLATGCDLKGRRVSAAALAKALTAAGYVTGETTVKVHRAGTCVCRKG